MATLSIKPVNKQDLHSLHTGAFPRFSSTQQQQAVRGRVDLLALLRLLIDLFDGLALRLLIALVFGLAVPRGGGWGVVVSLRPRGARISLPLEQKPRGAVASPWLRTTRAGAAGAAVLIIKF